MKKQNCSSHNHCFSYLHLHLAVPSQCRMQKKHKRSSRQMYLLVFPLKLSLQRLLMKILICQTEILTFIMTVTTQIQLMLYFRLAFIQKSMFPLKNKCECLPGNLFRFLWACHSSSAWWSCYPRSKCSTNSDYRIFFTNSTRWRRLCHPKFLFLRR